MEDNKGAAEVVDRKEGFYWVKFNGVDMVAYYKRVNEWYMINAAYSFREHDFSEIDERQIKRNCDCGRELNVQYYCNICDNDE